MTTNAALVENSPRAIGDIIDQLEDVRAQRRELSRQDRDLKALEQHLTNEILDALEDQKISSAAGSRYRATVSEELVPTVNDWDAAWEFIHEHRADYLLYRRMNASAWREMHLAGETVPGTVPFAKKSLSFTKL